MRSINSNIANMLTFILCLIGGYMAWRIDNVLKNRVEVKK